MSHRMPNLSATAETPLALGNRAMREGRFPEAIQQYANVLLYSPPLGKTIAANLAISKKRYRANRGSEDRPRVAVCGWELAHNAAGRVYALAMLYQTFAEVEIIGSLFPNCGREIWEPIRDTRIAKHIFVVDDETQFIKQAIALVAAHPYDIVHLSKPRAPNLIIGTLYKVIWDAKVLLDIDDDELGLVGEETPVNVDDYIQQHGALPELKDLVGKDWTRIAVGLAQAFDGITVATPALQQRYGGENLRHVRNASGFQPSPEVKRQSRHKFGIPPDKKLVLLFGIPRDREELLDAARVIASLKRGDVQLAIVGDFADPALKQALHIVAGVDLVFIGNPSLDSVPEVAAMGDACVLLQDTAAQFHLPTILSDALAMGVPVLGAEIPALADAVIVGAVLPISLPISPQNLSGQLAKVLDDPNTASRLQSAGRIYFQSEFSFCANKPALQRVAGRHGNQPLSAPLEQFTRALGGDWPNALLHPRKTNAALGSATLAKLPAPPTQKIAIVAHVHDPDLWPDIAQRLKAIDYPFDLYVTTTTARAPDVSSTVTADFAQVRIKVQPDRGRDVVPFLSLVPTLVSEGYLAVCKLQTSYGTDEQSAPWWRAILDVLVGNDATFTQVVHAFARHPLLQLAGPASLYQSARKWILDDEPALSDLFQQLEGHPLPCVDWGFFNGNMFWARPGSLQQLANYLVHHPDKLGSGTQEEGRLIHAIEGLFGLLPAVEHAQIGLLHANNRAALTERKGAGSEEEAQPASHFILQLTPPYTQIGHAGMGALMRQYARLAADLHKLDETGLFDTAHYLTQSPELPADGIDLPIHYLLIGRFQGKTPHPDFEPSIYTQRYAELLTGDQDPFLHYLHEGATAGLRLSATNAQEEKEASSFRYRVLNTALIDWTEQATKPREPNLISIVIPVFNQPELTQACVESLYQHTPKERFELVIVDNGSDLPTQELLVTLASQHPNLRLIRNHENLNVALGCNLGYAASQGEKAIFLSSATTVTAHWLEPLVEPLARSEISAVQPRLLYRDGTIQCMGIVFSEKSPLGYPIYVGVQPEESWAGRSRSFHAVTGACMALRAEDFARVKGFDPVFLDGQEDVDLCLRLNQNSHHRCWYVAESTLYCHVSPNESQEKFAQINRTAFCQRWAGKVPPDDEGHYLQDGFIAQTYHSDGSGPTPGGHFSAWRPVLKRIVDIALERPEDLEPYYFDLIKKSGLFDAVWYLKQYRGKFNIDSNPLGHYLAFGVQERLNPSPAFDTGYYVDSNPDLVNSELHPFIHYVAQGFKEGRTPLPAPPPEYFSKFSVSPPEYIPRLAKDIEPVEKAVRLIAFYLPQFHAIPENDEWWGLGFTEWSNVRPAMPQFEGHYQPHVPDDFIGYYNLLDRKAQARQIELAKQYGVGGFCFYLYWFSGQRLLEQPVDNYLNDATLDLPFCVCWANENWSRRWDGLDTDLLMVQHYSDEDDINFISSIAKYLRDPRYIRVNDKPLLIIYRPNLFPSMRETAERWRNWCLANGVGDVYLAYPQSFEQADPADYGFDAAIEFPPNNSAPPNITHKISPSVGDFQSIVYDWRILVERSEAYQDPGYKLFRAATPSWDNTARKKNKGTVFHNSCPKLFTKWLTNAFVDTLSRHKNPDEQIVFVNAWNEWAEGAHLEPDQRYGYAWLQAVREAHKVALQKRRRIVIVTHDAHPHGAQILCLNLARYFKEQFNFDVDLITLGEGRLIPKYAEYANVHQLTLANSDQQPINRLLTSLRGKGAEVAIVNTTVSGNIIPHFKAFGFSVVSLIHEMPGILKSYSLQEHAWHVAEHADKVVFPAHQVKEGFEGFIGKSLPQAVIRPQGLYLRSLLREGANKDTTRSAVRAKLGLPEKAKIIMCAGYADHRKGFDLFVRASLQTMAEIPDSYALWVGHLDQDFVDKSLALATECGRREQFVFTGLVDQPQEYYLAADIYALTSREDPFPSVVMEALDALTPVVAFRDCGGFENLLQRDCGILVPPEDCHAFAEAMVRLLRSPDYAQTLAANGQQIVETELSFRHYIFDLLNFASYRLPKVSAVVPNYKYEKYIRQRLETVVNQSYPLYELIVLDDVSPDNSVEVIQEFLHTCTVPSRLEVNEVNSGSVFKQWKKGVELARGDLVWIAEADDLAEADFLEHLVKFFNDQEVVLAFSQSKQIDEYDNLLANDYLDYTQDVGDFWQADYVIDGIEEIKRALCVKNTIPNVSGVLFRKDAVANALRELDADLLKYKVAGDWLLYLDLAKRGKMGFTSRPLNLHRRHVHSVTKAHNHLDEVVNLQKMANAITSLDDLQIAKMGAYIEKLSQHFYKSNLNVSA